MNDNEIEANIYENLATKDDVNQLLEVIDLLLDSMYKNDPGETEEILKNKAEVWFSGLIGNIRRSGVNLRSFLKKLRKDVSSLSEIKITIHDNPSESIVESVKNWVDQNLGKGVVVDFDVKSSLLGGAIVSYEGKYIDYSLEKRLDAQLNRMKTQLFRGLSTNDKAS